jgi:hypothetical protein
MMLLVPGKKFRKLRFQMIADTKTEAAWEFGASRHTHRGKMKFLLGHPVSAQSIEFRRSNSSV